jgi:hypothetical protein
MYDNENAPRDMYEIEERDERWLDMLWATR